MLLKCAAIYRSHRGRCWELCGTYALHSDYIKRDESRLVALSPECILDAKRVWWLRLLSMKNMAT